MVNLSVNRRELPIVAAMLVGLVYWGHKIHEMNKFVRKYERFAEQRKLDSGVDDSGSTRPVRELVNSK
jgi:hypothetical protein